MFERYNERARRILFFARYEASQLGNLSIAPEHVLLGILRESTGLTARILTAAGTSPESLRAELLAGWRPAEKVSTSVEIPFAEATKRILWVAAAEADALGDQTIGPEHLLLGLLREETSGPGRVLAAHGVRVDQTRRAIEQSLPEKPDERPNRTAAMERIERIRMSLVSLGITDTEGDGAPAQRAAIIRSIEAELDSLARLLREAL